MQLGIEIQLEIWGVVLWSWNYLTWVLYVGGRVEKVRVLIGVMLSRLQGKELIIPFRETNRLIAE